MKSTRKRKPYRKKSRKAKRMEKKRTRGKKMRRMMKGGGAYSTNILETYTVGTLVTYLEFLKHQFEGPFSTQELNEYIRLMAVTTRLCEALLKHKKSILLQKTDPKTKLWLNPSDFEKYSNSVHESIIEIINIIISSPNLDSSLKNSYIYILCNICEHTFNYIFKNKDIVDYAKSVKLLNITIESITKMFSNFENKTLEEKIKTGANKTIDMYRNYLQTDEAKKVEKGAAEAAGETVVAKVAEEAAAYMEAGAAAREAAEAAARAEAADDKRVGEAYRNLLI